MKLADIKADGDHGYISLTKLTGMPIKDIHVGLSSEWGQASLTMYRIVFEDGRFAWCEGEHDHPYIVVYDDGPPNLDDETLNALYREQRKEDGEDVEDDHEEE